MLLHSKKSIIINLIGLLLTVFVSYIIPKLLPSIIQYTSSQKVSVILPYISIFLLLFSLYLLSIIIFSESNIKIIKEKKANIFICIYNWLYYPRYFEHKGFIWHVGKTPENKFKVYLFCQDCVATVPKSEDDLDGIHYHCDGCGNEFNSIIIDDNLNFIYNVLKTIGIKYFKGHSKKYKKVIKTKC